MRIVELRVFVLRGGNVSRKVRRGQQKEQARHRGINLRRTGISHVLSNYYVTIDCAALAPFDRGHCDA